MRMLEEWKKIPGPEKQILALESREEAKEKEAILRRFYRERGFWNAEFSLDYLKLFKTPGKKRKDGITEDILHELNPCLLDRELLNNGILPEKVTHQELLYDDKSGIRQKYVADIPKAQQSIGRLFTTRHGHDLDEDFVEASPSHYFRYVRHRIEEEDKISKIEKKLLFSEARADAQSMKVMTFGRKKLVNGEVVNVPTHHGDRQVYSNHLEADWAAGSTKGGDRYDGVNSRFGYMANMFSIEKNKIYIDETLRLFMHRQILEDMADRFPELSQYLHIMNSRLNIAIRCLSAFIDIHPDNLVTQANPDVHPETAHINIRRFLDKAVQGSEDMNDGVDPYFERMLLGFQLEALRHPSLGHLVQQMETQLAPYVTPSTGNVARLEPRY